MNVIRFFRRFSILLALALCSSCGNQTPVVKSINTPGADRDGILAAQSELDEVLKEHSPFVFEELADAASDADIEKLRAALGGVERPYLELWYRWHNGGKEHAIGLLPLGAILSIDESVADRESVQDIPFIPQRRRRDIKLLDDGAGDGFFLDLTASPPRVYYEMLEDPYPLDYGTMEQFLNFIAKVHAAGIASVNERGVVVFEDATYQQLEEEHFASISAGE